MKFRISNLYDSKMKTVIHVHELRNDGGARHLDEHDMVQSDTVV